MASIFPPAPEPKTKLGYYRVLSPSASVRVSPLCLGGMSFGDAWKTMGHMTKESTFQLLDAFYDAGGNFIDVANNYHFGQSEEWLGDWMASRGIRDEMVIATKFTTGFTEKAKIRVNTQGNGLKSLHLSVKESLKRLQTDYIDILYLHWWDYTTSVEEVMQSLNNVVKSGQVLYLGISDAPAWIVSKANQYARDHGLAQFCVYQGAYNVIQRDLERDIIPMALSEKMGLTIWNALGGGKFQSAKDLEARKKANESLRATFNPDQTPDEAKASEALEKVAGELGTESVTAVALAYVMQKYPYVYPIIGGRKVEHLHSNIQALSLSLTDEQIKSLDSIKDFDIGFPFNFIGVDPKTNGGQVNFLMGVNGKYSVVEAEKAIKPAAK